MHISQDNSPIYKKLLIRHKEVCWVRLREMGEERKVKPWKVEKIEEKATQNTVNPRLF